MAVQTRLNLPGTAVKFCSCEPSCLRSVADRLWQSAEKELLGLGPILKCCWDQQHCQKALSIFCQPKADNCRDADHRSYTDFCETFHDILLCCDIVAALTQSRLRKLVRRSGCKIICSRARFPADSPPTRS